MNSNTVWNRENVAKEAERVAKSLGLTEQRKELLYMQMLLSINRNSVMVETISQLLDKCENKATSTNSTLNDRVAMMKKKRAGLNLEELVLCPRASKFENQQTETM
jgi:hypothetical protein